MSQTKKIESEIIEKHAVIVGRIYALIERCVEKKQSNKERYLAAYKNDDKETLDFGMGYERAINEILVSLEELTK